MSKAQVMFQLWEMMKHNKKYWLLPVIIVLVLIGALFVVAQSSALAPFIYSLF
jgi:competence protein ComGC